MKRRIFVLAFAFLASFSNGETVLVGGTGIPVLFETPETSAVVRAFVMSDLVAWLEDATGFQPADTGVETDRIPVWSAPTDFPCRILEEGVRFSVSAGETNAVVSSSLSAQYGMWTGESVRTNRFEAAGRFLSSLASGAVPAGLVSFPRSAFRTLSPSGFYVSPPNEVSDSDLAAEWEGISAEFTVRPPLFCELESAGPPGTWVIPFRVSRKGDASAPVLAFRLVFADGFWSLLL